MLAHSCNLNLNRHFYLVEFIPQEQNKAAKSIFSHINTFIMF